jgi:phosphonate transport system permease protein
MSASHTAAEAHEIAQWRASHPELFIRPPAIRWRNRAITFLFVAVTTFGLWWINASPVRLWHGLARLGFLLRLMIPPATGGAFGLYAYALFQTLAMAFLGTVLAAVLAFPLGFLAARTIVPNRLFHFALRRALDVIRGIDILIWALIFVSAVGMGPFAGVLAIVFSDVAFLTKTYAEAIENVDAKPIEGARASGANGLQTIRLAVLPQVLPVVLSNLLYFYESNVRAASVLGIVGAGGIGLQLSQRIFVNNWDQACFIIIMMLVTVALMDVVLGRVRRRLIGGRKTQG